MHLTALDVGVLLIYIAGLFVLGVVFSKRQTSNEEYFLGGRRLPWFLVGVSVSVTLLSTISYVGMPGELIRNGIGYFVWMPALILVTPLVNRMVIPPLMRLRVTSVYEYLGIRFGPSARSLGAVVFVCTRLLWTGLIIHAIALAVAEMTGWRMATIIVLVGLVTTFYATAGGISAVIWSDFAQFIIQIGGAIYIPLYVAHLTGVGPANWWETFSQAGRSTVPAFDWDPTVRLTMLGVILESILWNVCTHASDQVVAQRYFSTSSAAAARRSMWVYTLTQIVLTVLLMLCGLSLFYLYYSRSGLPLQAFQEQIAPEADKIMPRFIAAELPPGFSGLLLAALLAAAMSSLSSGINSISSVALTDFLSRFRRSGDRPASIKASRILAAVTGGLGIVTALAVTHIKQEDWNLVDLIHRLNHLFVAPLGVLMLVGILFRRVGIQAALLGFGAGVAASVTIAFSEFLFAPLGLERPISFTWIMPASFIVSLLTSVGTAGFFKSPDDSQLAALYRKG